jgi:hypothetical protein
VIWHPAGHGVDAELVAALRSKSIELVARADNEFAAFSTICGLAKQAGANCATVLLIMEPKLHSAAGQLAQMIARYPLRAVVWVYDTNTTPKLRAASARDFDLPSPGVEVPAAAEREAPKLRLASETGDLEEPRAPAHLLTDEELALLLASEPRPTT